MLEDYRAIRDEIIQLMEKLNGLGGQRLIEQAKALALDSQERLRSNKFNLVVLGEFKRGKSTFINCLLSSELLPTSVIPLTSIVTIVRYGEREEAIVTFQDGQTKTISIADLSTYVTESGNAKNWRRVYRVEVLYPSQLLRDGVQLIDTPGVGSVYEHNTMVAHEFLPNADAAIFLIAADPPISKGELEFLRTVKQHVPKMFFVQNKIDRLTPDELRESLEFNRRVIEEDLGTNSITIFPISAKLALQAKLTGDAQALNESGVLQFERVLSNFLLRERGTIALISGTNTALKTASDILLTIDLETKALQMPLEELERKLHLFNERMAAIHRQKEEDLYLVRQLLVKLVTDRLDEDLARLRSERKKWLYQQLISACEGFSDRTASAMLAKVNSVMPALVQDALTEWQEQETKKLSDLLDEKLQPYTEKVNNLIDQTREICEDVFDIKLEYFEPDRRLSGFSKFFVRSWSIQVTFDITVLPLLHLIPAKWIKAVIRRAAWKRLWEEFDMHCGQLRYDLLQRVEASIREYTGSLEAKIDDTAEEIQQAVRKAMADKSEGQAAVESTLRKLGSERSIVEGIASRLLAIRDSLTMAYESAGCSTEESICNPSKE